jgi:hypothetical protein
MANTRSDHTQSARVSEWCTFERVCPCWRQQHGAMVHSTVRACPSAELTMIEVELSVLESPVFMTNAQQRVAKHNA